MQLNNVKQVIIFMSEPRNNYNESNKLYTSKKYIMGRNVCEKCRLQKRFIINPRTFMMGS